MRTNHRVSPAKLQTTPVLDHFVDTNKSIPDPKGGERMIEDLFLTRYASYLRTQNGDPRKGKRSRLPGIISRPDRKHPPCSLRHSLLFMSSEGTPEYQDILMKIYLEVCGLCGRSIITMTRESVSNRKQSLRLSEGVLSTGNLSPALQSSTRSASSVI